MAKSLNAYRLPDNLLEKRFVDMWDRQNEVSYILEYILSAEANRAIPISARDAQVAVTVIQWLGSPIGQAFLEDTLGIENLRKQVSAILPKLAPV